eukprot:m.1387216 g.1387216  ORF g.1387216 m.1387216 type:complete len:148 (+) comp24980_c1_seq1:267-710(+)
MLNSQSGSWMLRNACSEATTLTPWAVHPEKMLYHLHLLVVETAKDETVIMMKNDIIAVEARGIGAQVADLILDHVVEVQGTFAVAVETTVMNEMPLIDAHVLLPGVGMTWITDHVNIALISAVVVVPVIIVVSLMMSEIEMRPCVMI